MIDKDTVVKVTNRDNGTVGYTIPDMHNLHRSFRSGETKDIRMEELRKLCFNTNAGKNLLENYFIIDNKEAVKELLNQVEPEYYYTDEDVKKLLTEGSVAQLEDCLNFGTEGVVNLVKKYAVDLKINDLSKRDLILEKTGFNVNSAIAIAEETKEDGGNETVTTKVRKASPITKENESQPVRKANVIKK